MLGSGMLAREQASSCHAEEKQNATTTGPLAAKISVSSLLKLVDVTLKLRSPRRWDAMLQRAVAL
jgi:hypothetical protein